MTQHIDVPYLIVGAGPVGLTAARLLANQGRECLIVERRDGPQTQPAAHVINARTLDGGHVSVSAADDRGQPLDGLAATFHGDAVDARLDLEKEAPAL